MASADQFDIGSVYTFTTHAPTVLGTYSHVLIDGISDYQVARHFIDPAKLHVQIYNALPSSVPDDHRKYNYLLLTRSNGERTALGLPWIDENSIEAIQRQRIEVLIEDVGVEDVERVRKLLLANGYTLNNIELKE